MNEKPYSPPPGKHEKIQHLYELYRDSKYLKDKDIFEEIIQLTDGAVSVITLKRYKKEFKWERPKKLKVAKPKPPKSRAKEGKKKKQKTKQSSHAASSKKKRKPNFIRVSKNNFPPDSDEPPAEPALQFDDIPMPPRTGDDKGVYTTHEKIRIVERISALYATFEHDLFKTCKMAGGVAISTFYRWINDDAVLKNIFNQGLTEKDLHLITTLEHEAQKAAIDMMKTRELVEEKITYVYEQKLDEETGELVEVEKRKFRHVYRRQVLPNSAAILDVFRYANEKKSMFKNDSMPSPAEMDDETLEKKIQDLKAKVKHEVEKADRANAGS